MILLSRIGYLRALILAGLLGLPQIANPQTPDLSPKAQEAFSRGLAAAQQQDWKLAIRCFLDAHKVDPDAPQIWFNLGLASSKLPGWELRAIAWLKAYQEAVPNAPNTKALAELVAGLGARLEGNIGRLTEQLVPATRALSGGDRLELPYATFLLVRDEASANAVAPRQKPVGIISLGGGVYFYSRYAGALSRAGKLEIALSAARGSPQAATRMIAEVVEYLLEQSRLDDAVRILRPFIDKLYTARHGVGGSAVRIACKAREAGRTELVSQMFSAVKDEIVLQSYPEDYFDFALWLGQAEEIDRSYSLLAHSYKRDGISLAREERSRREDVGNLPPHCRKVWWLKGERRAYLLDLATNGITIRGWPFDTTRSKLSRSRFDETRFKELTEATKQIKDQDASDEAMTEILAVLANSAYAYRNINP